MEKEGRRFHGREFRLDGLIDFERPNVVSIAPTKKSSRRINAVGRRENLSYGEKKGPPPRLRLKA